MSIAHQLLPMFASPMYNARIAWSEEDKEKVSQLDYHRIRFDNGWISNDKYVLNQFPKMKAQILKHVNFYVNEILDVDPTYMKVELTNSWITKHEKGDSSHRHYHQNSMISGISYIHTDLLSGDIHFEKDNMFPRELQPTVKKNNMWNSAQFSFKPEPGDMFLFPSNIDHRVDPSESEDDRYACAFNIFITGQYGTDAIDMIDLRRNKDA